MVSVADRRARFLVRIEVRLPPSLPVAERADLLERERERGLALRAAGTIEDIWRIPGRQANFGIWRAADASELHEALCSLPVWPWTEIEVTALADHHLTRDPARSVEDGR
jgi:muconolactone D-isomerase